LTNNNRYIKLDFVEGVPSEEFIRIGIDRREIIMAVEKKSIAKPEVKADAATKAEPAKKPAAKKPAAKKATAKKPAVKKATAKKAELKAKVVLQLSDGREYTEADLIGNAKNVWKYDLGKKTADLTKVELYVKPEDNKVYYVMNDVEGDFNL